jgi:hypothetical protein
LPPPHPRHDCAASWCSAEGDQRTPRPREPSLHAQAVRPRHPRACRPTQRAGRVRHLIFVDDFVASGISLRREVERWLKHPTIRSWISSGYLTLHSAAFAATSRGLAKARELAFPFLAYDNSCDLKAVAIRTDEVNYEDARRLVAKYGTGKKRGFGRAEGMIVIQHTVPNSLPAIFTQDRTTNNEPWPRLFNRHTYELSGDLESAWPHSPSRRVQDLLLEHLPLITPSWMAVQPDTNLEALLVARLSTHRRLKPDEIAQEADLPLDRVNQLLRKLQLLGLDDPRQLNRELRSASSAGKHVRTEAPPKSRYYFPRFIREHG